MKNHYKKIQDDEIDDILLAKVSPSVKLKEILLRLYAYLKENEMFAYHFYFFLTEMYRLNESGEIPSKKPNENGFANKIYELINDGIKTGEFRNDFSPCELLSSLFSNIIGIVVTYLLIPKNVKEYYKLPNVSLITSSILNHGGINEEKFNV